MFISHSEAVNVEFANPVDEKEARAALKKAPGVIVIDHRADEGYVTPIEAAGEDAVYVSRIRKDPTDQERTVVLVRVGQSAQGRGAQRRADRRGADQGLSEMTESLGGKRLSAIPSGRMAQ